MSELKEGVKYDEGKLDWTLLPFDALKEVVEVMEFGAKVKYERDNWKRITESERYTKAAFRHLIQYQYESKTDDETGKSHLAHAVFCLLCKMWHDKHDQEMKINANEIEEKSLEYTIAKQDLPDGIDDLFDDTSRCLS